jgi:hypothetical protein
MAALILMVSIFLRTYHMLFYLLKSTSYYAWRFSEKDISKFNNSKPIFSVNLTFLNYSNKRNWKKKWILQFLKCRSNLQLFESHEKSHQIISSINVTRWTQNTERGIRPWLGKTHTIRINGKKSNTGRTNATRLINVSS